MPEIQETVVRFIPLLMPVVNDLGEADTIAHEFPKIVEVAQSLCIITY